ncbi:hypothetical protein TrST_g11473 [Triparma strigata]|uniref:Uncharacterized protein n=1 Tax=Triparma strigata TaxID=1606541 RepID=A0A9W7E855_9STRA|nr:hypothetical protein TrST_g11473 [Triparma strigata]
MYTLLIIAVIISTAHAAAILRLQLPSGRVIRLNAAEVTDNDVYNLIKNETVTMDNVTLSVNDTPLSLNPSSKESSLSTYPHGTLIKAFRPLPPPPPKTYRQLNPPFPTFLTPPTKKIQKTSSLNTYKSLSTKSRPQIPLTHHSPLKTVTVKTNAGRSLTQSKATSHILIGRRISPSKVEVIAHHSFPFSSTLKSLKSSVKKVRKLSSKVSKLNLSIVGVGFHGSIPSCFESMCLLNSCLGLNNITSSVCLIINEGEVEGLTVSEQVCQLVWGGEGEVEGEKEGDIKVVFKEGVVVNEEIRRQIELECFYRFLGVEGKEGGWFEEQQGGVGGLEDLNGWKVLGEGAEEVGREAERIERGRKGKVSEKVWREYKEWYDER